jgi:hypothetical protein
MYRQALEDEWEARAVTYLDVREDDFAIFWPGWPNFAYM